MTSILKNNTTQLRPHFAKYAADVGSMSSRFMDIAPSEPTVIFDALTDELNKMDINPLDFRTGEEFVAFCMENVLPKLKKLPSIKSTEGRMRKAVNVTPQTLGMHRLSQFQPATLDAPSRKGKDSIPEQHSVVSYNMTGGGGDAPMVAMAGFGGAVAFGTGAGVVIVLAIGAWFLYDTLRDSYGSG